MMVCVSQIHVHFSYIQEDWTLLHCAALGGSVGLIEWLMANHKFAVEAKTKVLLCPHMLH